ncbi:uncharacterized protein LOC129582259 [Paramacrobiotus metropolitanus]|uniref:uncharacterized protein LOC129582259 n=1 Tax=Paramacrobiotus metropolitanus TaxID=2943436 RepID=UPI002445F26B|nr:uncharacterized protein LOC129582259 [Paramacrobiotus metropolitanus]
MGGRSSRPSVDVGAIMRSHEEAMQRREQEYREQRDRDTNQFNQRFTDLTNANAAESQRQQEEFQRQQQRWEAEQQAEKTRYEGRIQDLEKNMQEPERQLNDVQEQLRRPIIDRENKVNFVNGLQLQIKQTDSLLLLGPKGMGKSTFLWLLNKGAKPHKTTTDGTVEIIQVSGFVDSIGLRGWTPEELLKLLVLMIYEGIPRDLIIFGNDRIDLPITSLGLLGVNNPMIVIMSSDFWRNLEPVNGGRQRIHLVENEQKVRRVQPVEDLDLVYNLPVYEDIQQFHLGTPITHHDNIELLVNKRREAGIRPFQFLMDRLGAVFKVGMENEANTEALFRFIYLFETKYNKDRLRFMNFASLQEFA